MRPMPPGSKFQGGKQYGDGSDLRIGSWFQGSQTPFTTAVDQTANRVSGTTYQAGGPTWIYAQATANAPTIQIAPTADFASGVTFDTGGATDLVIYAMVPAGWFYKITSATLSAVYEVS